MLFANAVNFRIPSKQERLAKLLMSYHRSVALGLKGNSVCTLDYSEFDWQRFKKELAKQGVEVIHEDAVPCG